MHFNTVLGLVLGVCANVLGTVVGQGLAEREYTQILTVPNGGLWGLWRDPEFCRMGAYAIGYNIKYRDYHLFGDDTSLNGIRLLCSDIEGEFFGETITSGVGHDGEWMGRVTCSERPGKIMFLSDFRLQVHVATGGHDDTAANWVEFQCRDMEDQTILEELNHDPFEGDLGHWGKWSELCAKGTAICGLSTRIQSYQSGDDDTSLNDVKFYCCDVPEAKHPTTTPNLSTIEYTISDADIVG